MSFCSIFLRYYISGDRLMSSHFCTIVIFLFTWIIILLLLSLTSCTSVRVCPILRSTDSELAEGCFEFSIYSFVIHSSNIPYNIPSWWDGKYCISSDTKRCQQLFQSYDVDLMTVHWQIWKPNDLFWKDTMLNVFCKY